jgi:hypothetical protein
MIRDATSDATTRLISKQISYDRFLAEVGQTVSVCIESAINAVKKLAMEPGPRRQFGLAGRARAEKYFGWQQVVAAYESMWQQQREQLSASHRKSPTVAFSSTMTTCTPNRRLTSPSSASREREQSVLVTPSLYPPIDISFADYPTNWLHPQTIFQRMSGDLQRIVAIANDPLVNHSVTWHDQQVTINSFMQTLNSLSLRFSLSEFENTLQKFCNSPINVPSVLAWFLKYGVIRVNDAQLIATHEATPFVTFVTTCMGRLEDLQQTLPIMVAQENATVIVVDYSCPQCAGKWVRATFPQVQVIDVQGKTFFDRSDAKNRGVEAARTAWVCVVDADMLLDPQFIPRTRALLIPGRVVRSDAVKEGTGGTFFFEKQRFTQVGGHDPVFFGWGEQDEDLVNAIQFTGAQLIHFPASLLRHREHDDQARTRYHQDTDRKRTHMINRMYRAAKWDWARLTGEIPTLHDRQKLHRMIRERIAELQDGQSEVVIEIETGDMQQNPFGVKCRRTLRFTVMNRS